MEGREFLIKRDDLIDPYLAGNKYRKLYTLVNTPSDRYDTIISYGGTQSNAMVAIAKLCHDKNWRFLYYTKPLSEYQKRNVVGNYKTALDFGMEHTEVEHRFYKDFITSLTLSLDSKTFLVHQGGADKSAKEGIVRLAEEIRAQNPSTRFLATPSGTGTTALFLAQALPEFVVYTTPCVGDAAYLKEQMRALAPLPSNLVVLEPEKRYRFAKVYCEFYALYEKLKAAGVEFDLLYAPLLWKMLLEKTHEKILYIHSGGVSGNVSMLKRYARAKC